MTTARIALLAALSAGTLLGACGRVGMLEQPAPLYGAKAKADYQARKAAEAKAAATRREQGEPEILAEPSPSTEPPLPAGAAPPPNVAPPTPQPSQSGPQ